MKERQRIAARLAAICLEALLLHSLPVCAQDSSSGAPTAKSDELLQLGEAPAGAYAMQARLALSSNRFDRAIHFSKLALKKDYTDIDAHAVYAEALENKFVSDGGEDYSLLRLSLSEWLVVMRSDVGEEKGLSVLGPGVLSYLYGSGDTERYERVRYHLKELVGTLPRPWETTNGFLSRALKTKQEVRGKIISGGKDPARKDVTEVADRD